MRLFVPAQAAALGCGFQQIDHLSYSPDVAPSADFFCYLKKDLRMRRCRVDFEKFRPILRTNLKIFF